MQTSTFKDYQAQCTFSDMALFDLLRAVSDLKDCENELTSLDIEHIQVGAKVLNALLARKTPFHVAKSCPNRVRI